MIVVGKFKKTHGINGEIKVESYFTNKDDLTKYNLFFLEDKTEINLSVFKKKNLLICKILNVESPESANKYVNKFLYIDPEQLPKLKNNQHYFYDLVGLNVKINKDYVGYIISVHNHGAGDYIEIKKNSLNDIFLVPFNSDHILEINTEKKEILLNPTYYRTNEI